MNIREYLNNNPAVVTIAAVVVLVICLALIVLQLSGGRSSGPIDLWYYDTGSKQLVIAESDQNPPMPSDSGGEIVRAHLFACGSCDDKIGDIDEGMGTAEVNGASVFLVYVEKMTDETKAKMDQMRDNPEAAPSDDSEYAQIEAGQRFAMVNDDGSLGEWIAPYPMTEEVPEKSWDEILQDRLSQLCPTGDARPCPRPQ